MKPNKAEIDALAGVLHTPLQEFVTDRERAEHRDPEALAKSRMFTRAIEAVDQARADRGFWTLVLRMGEGSSTLYVGYGPYATQAQARKELDRMAPLMGPTAYAIVPTRNEESIPGLIEKTDERSTRESSVFGLIRQDVADFKAGKKVKARGRW